MSYKLAKSEEVMMLNAIIILSLTLKMIAITAMPSECLTASASVPYALL
jgi:hypothetical protein